METVIDCCVDSVRVYDRAAFGADLYINIEGLEAKCLGQIPSTLFRTTLKKYALLIFTLPKIDKSKKLPLKFSLKKQDFNYFGECDLVASLDKARQNRSCRVNLTIPLYKLKGSLGLEIDFSYIASITTQKEISLPPKTTKAKSINYSELINLELSARNKVPRTITERVVSNINAPDVFDSSSTDSDDFGESFSSTQGSKTDKNNKQKEKKARIKDNSTPDKSGTKSNQSTPSQKSTPPKTHSILDSSSDSSDFAAIYEDKNVDNSKKKKSKREEGADAFSSDLSEFNSDSKKNNSKDKKENNLIMSSLSSLSSSSKIKRKEKNSIFSSSSSLSSIKKEYSKTSSTTNKDSDDIAKVSKPDQKPPPPVPVEQKHTSDSPKEEKSKDAFESSESSDSDEFF